MAGLAVATLAVTATVDPNEPGHYPLCPTKLLTGLDCPGCGSLRALHSLGTGDLAGAADHNLLLVLSVPLLGWFWLRWARRSWLGQPRSVPAAPGWVWALLALVAAFTVLRNMPGVPFLGSELG